MSAFQNFELARVTAKGGTTSLTNSGLGLGLGTGSVVGISDLGFGLKGFIPQQLITTDSSAYGPTRLYLREAFDTSYLRQKTLQGVPARINSPFRLVTNAGDKLSRVNYTCGGYSNQGSRPQNRGLKQLWGSTKFECDGTGIEAANCNTKYVYDGSDYTAFLRNRSYNKTYNLPTNGGNAYNTSQTAIRHIKRGLH
jgi:hypothetical protein